jgi:cytochrome c oxidase cbb3-type subunit 2
LTGIGKNQKAMINAIQEICQLVYSENPKDKNLQDMLVENLSSGQPFSPKTILTGVTKEIADAASDKLTTAGGKVEIHIIATGADISRGWGIRRSVATDFLWDYPVQLGNLRAGPDLANVGARLGNANWQLQHLYAPQSVMEKSAMPPFKFLFETRKMNGAPSPDALQLSGKFASPADYEIVPTEDAKNLAAYLLSLRADVPLYEAPFTPQQVSTNSVVEKK